MKRLFVFAAALAAGVAVAASPPQKIVSSSMSINSTAGVGCERTEPDTATHKLVVVGTNCVVVSQQRPGQRSCNYTLTGRSTLSDQDVLEGVCGCRLSVSAMGAMSDAEVLRRCPVTP